MAHFVQIILDGTVIGSTYALVALGFTLVFGVLGVLNVAHADFYTLGAYVSLWVGTQPPPLFGKPLGVLAAVIAGGIAGLILYSVVLRRLAQQQQMLAVFVATLGVSFFLQNALARLVGPDTVTSPPLFNSEFHNIAGVRVSDAQILLLLATGVIAVGLIRWIGQSHMGRDMRAVAEDSDLAQAVGVKVAVVLSSTIAIASGIAALTGVLVTNVTQTVSPFLATEIGLKMFIVAMAAGAGSIRGAVVAGMVLGIAESFAVAYLGSSWQHIVGLVVLIVVLSFRPQGFFGKKLQVA